MNFLKINILMLVSILLNACQDTNNITPTIDKNYNITTTSATYNPNLEQVTMQINVEGLAGASLPTAVGQLDGAPVLGYVFPTTLNPTDVGFNNTTGIVAMALTSHPDFDDTPLWDENVDGNYNNDGIIWHPHWVLLIEDSRVEGGLSVKQFDPNNNNVILPPTNPGMPIYMDSPGYQVITKDKSITVVIPTAFINGKINFNFDAVTVRMQVNTSDPNLPMLGVYEVYKILSEDLSLPYTIQ